MKSILNSSYRNIFLYGLFVFIITSIFSSGYFHPDEHFQILEFCNYKSGNSPASDLPWEYGEKIRSCLQPALCYLHIKGLNLLGIKNPFHHALILRVLSSLFSWFLLSKICLLLLDSFSTEKGRKLFLLLTFFLWFVPLISVRFSSENYSSLALISAVYFMLTYTKQQSSKLYNLFLAGLFLGFSFFFRFQIGFAIMGIGLWLIFIEKLNLKKLLLITSGGLLAFAICIYIDYWFYGDFVISPINYFNANIIQGKAANWGTDPWWYYFILVFINGIPPVSLILLAGFFAGLYKDPKNLFVWIIIPFLLGHFMVGHKELRFLFPVTFYFIYLSAIGFDSFLDKYKMNSFYKSISAFAVILNLLLLVFVLFTPAQPVVKYYEFLYDYSTDHEVYVLSKEKDVYEIVGLDINFYKHNNIKSLVFKDDVEIADYLNTSTHRSVLLVERDFSKPVNYPGYTSNTVYSILPPWIKHINYNNWISRSRIWKIVELEKTEPVPLN